MKDLDDIRNNKTHYARWYRLRHFMTTKPIYFPGLHYDVSIFGTFNGQRFDCLMSRN